MVKTVIILLMGICICVIFCAFYSAWTGHGLLFINTGLLTTGLMLAVLLAIFIFYFFQFIHKRAEWRKWLLRTAVLTIGWATTFCIIIIGSRPAIQFGRYFYWQTYRSELESIAANQLERYQTNGVYSVPTGEITQLDYPVFVQINSTNHLQVVGFSQFATTPSRRSGFLFVKDPNERAMNAIRASARGIKQLNTNWFEYGEYEAEP